MYLFLKYASMLLLVGYLLPYPCMAQQNIAKANAKLEIKEIGRQTVSVPSISEENPSVIFNTNKEITQNYKCRADFDGVNKLAVRLEDGTTFPIKMLSGNTKISTDGNRIFNIGFHPMRQAGYIAIEILDRQGKVIKYCETDLFSQTNPRSIEFQNDGTFWIAGLRYEALPETVKGSRRAKSKVVLMHFDTNGNQLNEIETPTYENNFTTNSFAIAPNGQYLAINILTVETIKRQTNIVNTRNPSVEVKQKLISGDEIVSKYFFFNKSGKLIYKEDMTWRIDFIKFIDKDKFVLLDKDECGIYHIDTQGNVIKKMEANMAHLLGYDSRRTLKNLLPLNDAQLVILYEKYPKDRTQESGEIRNYQLVIVDMQQAKILAEHHFKAPLPWHVHKNLTIKDNVLSVLTRKENIQFELKEK